MSLEEFDKLTEMYIAAVKEHRHAHREFMEDIRDGSKKHRYEAALKRVEATGSAWHDAWKSSE